jgi:hypothetical protein
MKKLFSREDAKYKAAKIFLQHFAFYVSLREMQNKITERTRVRRNESIIVVMQMG